MYTNGKITTAKQFRAFRKYIKFLANEEHSFIGYHYDYEAHQYGNKQAQLWNNEFHPQWLYFYTFHHRMRYSHITKKWASKGYIHQCDINWNKFIHEDYQKHLIDLCKKWPDF